MPSYHGHEDASFEERFQHGKDLAESRDRHRRSQGQAKGESPNQETKKPQPASWAAFGHAAGIL